MTMNVLTCPPSSVWIPWDSAESARVPRKPGEQWFYRSYQGNPTYKGRCVSLGSLPANSVFVTNPVPGPSIPHPLPVLPNIPGNVAPPPPPRGSYRSPMPWLNATPAPSETPITTTPPPPGQIGPIIDKAKQDIVTGIAKSIGLFALLTAPAWAPILFFHPRN